MDGPTNSSQARDILEQLVARGVHHLNTKQAVRHFGRTTSATKRTLTRLREKGLLATPYPGFHLIVEPQHRPFGCPPPEQWIPQLMALLERPYYVALLSAGLWHGAAHQKPMVFQVIVPQPMRNITCGRVRVHFVTRHNTTAIPTVKRVTPTGFVEISTPEATAFDLVGYPLHAAGLSNAATVLTELAEVMDAQRLVEAAPLSPTPWAQRLGYILDLLEDTQHLTGPLADYVAGAARRYTPLRVRKPNGSATRSERWKIIANTEIEPDL